MMSFKDFLSAIRDLENKLGVQLLEDYEAYNFCSYYDQLVIKCLVHGFSFDSILEGIRNTTKGEAICQ